MSGRIDNTKGRPRQQDATILLVGDATTCVDIEYATGFRAVDPVVFFKRGDRRVLVVPAMEAGRAEKEAQGCVIETPASLGLAGDKRRRLSEWAVYVVRRERESKIVVPFSFPFGVAERLRQNGIKVVPTRDQLFPQRNIKSIEEQDAIRKAQEAAVIAMRAAIRRLADSEINPGGYLVWNGRRLAAEDLRRLINRILVEHDYFARDTIVAPGLQGADPHAKGEGPLRAGESIVLDIFPQSIETGYWGDLTRTVVRGSAPAPLRAMYHAVRAAQEIALSMIRPGARGETIHRAVQAEFERRGFRTEAKESSGAGFIHSTGHGVGLAIHESPVLGPGGGSLRAGNVITVEPGLYYPGIGAIRIEDTVLVTRDGWSYFAPCEKKLEIGPQHT